MSDLSKSAQYWMSLNLLEQDKILSGRASYSWDELTVEQQNIVTRHYEKGISDFVELFS